VCFSTEDCAFKSSEECLKQALFLAQREIIGLKEKANMKHTRTSIKWRDSSFYYKKRVKQLLEIIKENGLESPQTYVIPEGEPLKEGGLNDGLDNPSKANSNI